MKKICDILLILFASGASVSLGILIIYLAVIEKDVFSFVFSFFPIILGIGCLFANKDKLKRKIKEKKNI